MIRQAISTSPTFPPFNESKKKNRRASQEWLVEGGDVPFALYVIRGSEVCMVVDPF